MSDVHNLSDGSSGAETLSWRPGGQGKNLEMKQFDLIVIGAGISGMAVAMRAIEAGMRVAVIDEHATVGEGASFFHSGVALPSPLDPWYGPDAPMPTPGGVPWRRAARERASNALRHARLAPWEALIAQSAARLDTLAQVHGIEHERRDGALYVWRNAVEFERAQALLVDWPKNDAPPEARNTTSHATPSDIGGDDAVDHVATDAQHARTGKSAQALADVDLEGNGAPGNTPPGTAPRFDLHGHAPRVLDAQACRAAEPALEHAEALAGGIAFDTLSSGNAAVMAKRLKQLLDAAEVTFFLARQALRVEVHNDGVDVSIRPAQQAGGAFSGVQARGFTPPSTTSILGVDARQSDAARHVEQVHASHVVIAAGAGSAKLLGTAGVPLPLQRVTRTVLTGTVLREDYAPRRLLIDAENSVAIVRFDRRVRVSACLRGPATTTIGKVKNKAAALPPGPAKKALQAMPAQLHAWRDTLVPGAARFDAGVGESVALVGADGLPVIGTLKTRRGENRLHVVLSGAHRGWGLAFGAADLLFAQWPSGPHAAMGSMRDDNRTQAIEANAHPVTEEGMAGDGGAAWVAATAADRFDPSTRMALSPARFGHA